MKFYLENHRLSYVKRFIEHAFSNLLCNILNEQSFLLECHRFQGQSVVNIAGALPHHLSTSDFSHSPDQIYLELMESHLQWVLHIFQYLLMTLSRATQCANAARKQGGAEAMGETLSQQGQVGGAGGRPGSELQQTLLQGMTGEAFCKILRGFRVMLTYSSSYSFPPSLLSPLCLFCYLGSSPKSMADIQALVLDSNFEGN